MVELSGTRVLVVEDEYYMADDLRRAIMGGGAQVVGAYEQQGVYLRHGPVDPPVGAESSPVSDELGLCFC